MKRLFDVILILTAPCFLAQNAFQKGTTALNLGVGVGNFYGFSWFAQGYSYIPYLNLAADHSFHNLDKNIDLGLGGFLGFQSFSYTSNQTWYTNSGKLKSGTIRQRWNYFSFGVRPSIHYSLEDTPLDLYGAALIGYTIVSYDVNDPEYLYSYHSSRPIFGLIAGARYYFNSKAGAFAEVGYGISLLNLGFSIKL